MATRKKSTQTAPRITKRLAASKRNTSALTQNDLAILAETFRLLGDPSRLRILLCCLDDSSSVGEIAERLELSQSLVSHHLRLLRGARLVKGERQAKQVFYTVADNHVSRVLLDMANHITEEDGELEK